MTEKIHHKLEEESINIDSKNYDQYDRQETKEHNANTIDKDERASKEVLDIAIEIAKQAENHESKTHPNTSPAENRRVAPSKKQRENTFKSSIKEVQGEMDPTSRLTSKVIHNPLIEKTSDIVGSTVARPNAMLSGSISAFIFVTLFYFIAKNYGYQLSNFETIAAFVIGWVFGLIYDYFRILIQGNRK
ncbi:MAG: hypothetical protein WAW80_00685 [Candidatus Saccharimonadales bacterium]